MVTLEQSRVFSKLPPRDLQALQQLAQERRFSPGRQVFQEGDPGDGLYLVNEGLVEISVTLTGGLRQVLSEIGPGELFGEMAVFEDKARSAGAVAKQHTVAAFLPRQEILKLIEKSPPAAFALLREISRRLREFDRQYLREVLQAERLAVVGRFARSIIHDIKNPLNIIGLTSEMVGMGQITPELREQGLATIRQQVERISDLITEILDFTQGSSRNLVLPPVSYRTFVEQVLQGIRQEGALKGVAVEVANPAPPDLLLLDAKRLRRVFYNLVHNATDAMPEGGKITWRFESTPAEIITEIEDTGPGIAPEISGQLFQPFATHGKVHGTGLGLSICKRIIEDHKGWIAARPQPGHGAIFAFGLPRPQA